ncbi:hypothetical protein M6B38_360785 [Iris pallida]|uniref:Uncharacterized protein n=1 Tax=Iris pallida TaxID=29817 RepID=A0AAX6G468_IRIPA|nr:hypothetical protein M6B38_383050 [Iris pallida]KAJ6828722.1 hypothetical protein M6B38_360785 [Iris pallida]
MDLVVRCYPLSGYIGYFVFVYFILNIVYSVYS